MEQEVYQIPVSEFFELPECSQAELLYNRLTIIRDDIVHVFVDLDEIYNEDAIQPEDLF